MESQVCEPRVCLPVHTACLMLAYLSKLCVGKLNPHFILTLAFCFCNASRCTPFAFIMCAYNLPY